MTETKNEVVTLASVVRDIEGLFSRMLDAGYTRTASMLIIEDDNSHKLQQAAGSFEGATFRWDGAGEAPINEVLGEARRLAKYGLTVKTAEHRVHFKFFPYRCPQCSGDGQVFMDAEAMGYGQPGYDACYKCGTAGRIGVVQAFGLRFDALVGDMAANEMNAMRAAANEDPDGGFDLCAAENGMSTYEYMQGRVYDEMARMRKDLLNLDYVTLRALVDTFAPDKDGVYVTSKKADRRCSECGTTDSQAVFKDNRCPRWGCTGYGKSLSVVATPAKPATDDDIPF